MGSEKVTKRWVEGIERVCRDCGKPIRNLELELGQVHRDFERGVSWLRCMDCRPGAKAVREREDAKARKGSGVSAC